MNLITNVSMRRARRVCSACGRKHGAWTAPMPNSYWKRGTCDLCKRDDVLTTNAANYGITRDWKSKIVER